ncbi:MAG: hypothetical protein MJ062_00870 [Oscillospiraceae bacterium]|nr:hypothetical protein [Oscillospiraceae bacterium]
MLELTIMMNHGKYLVTDSKKRTLYSIKKKLRGEYVIRDASKYELYELSEGQTMDRHMFYYILLNGKRKATLRCVSKFLEPRMELEEEDGSILTIRAETPDKLSYTFVKDKKEYGTLKIHMLSRTEYKFVINIDVEIFDDYLPLIPFAVIESIPPTVG